MEQILWLGQVGVDFRQPNFQTQALTQFRDRQRAADDIGSDQAFQNLGLSTLVVFWSKPSLDQHFKDSVGKPGLIGRKTLDKQT